jgi:hypothetical protein
MSVPTAEGFPAGNLLVPIPGVSLTPTSLIAGRELSWREWDSLLSDLARLENRARWWIGDLLIQGEVWYGHTYENAEKLTGLKRQTLKHYKRIAQRIDPPRRRSELTWSHHRRVEQLAPAEQDRWLDRAVAGHWTAQELEEEMLRDRAESTPEQFPDTQDNGDPPCCPWCHRPMDAVTLARLETAGMLQDRASA